MGSMVSGDRLREWCHDRADGDLLDWARSLLDAEQVSAPGLTGDRVAVAVGVQRVTFDIDPNAIVEAAWAHDSFARLVPSCDCIELDPWCVHAVAAVFGIARALDVDPSSLDRVLAAAKPTSTSWMSIAFASVSASDRKRLHKTLAFCFHPDRRGGDEEMYLALSETWSQWSNTAT
jgi:hypothetical protein